MGKLLLNVLKMIDKVRPVTGIGINCSKPEYVESLIRIFVPLRTNLLRYIQILVKAMIVKTKTWYGDPASFVDYVDVWRKAGG